MFRFFERLVDPYQPYPVSNCPPRALSAFLRDYLRPFKTIFCFSALFQTLVAAVQIFLIWYFGRLIVLMTEATPSEFWGNHWVELALVTGFILVIRPLIDTVSTLLLNNTILPNVALWCAIGRIAMCCGNLWVGLKMILLGALPIGSCKPRLRRVNLSIS